LFILQENAHLFILEDCYNFALKRKRYFLQEIVTNLFL